MPCPTNSAWTPRNRTRLNLLLDLVRLRIDKLNSQVLFASAVRKHRDGTAAGPPTLPPSPARTEPTVEASTHSGPDRDQESSLTGPRAAPSLLGYECIHSEEARTPCPYWIDPPRSPATWPATGF